jgi:capsular exopolysaccharide synthesis family protein
VIRARKWIIIQAVFVVTLVAVVVSMQQAPAYQGEAKILITGQDVGSAIFGSTSNDLGDPARGLDTQVQLLQVRSLAEIAVGTLDFSMSPGALLDQVSIAAIGQTNVITVTAVDGDPAHAAAIANALADAYVKWSRDTKRESIKAAADEVQSRLDQAKSEVLALSKQIQTLGKTDERTAELNIAVGTYTRLSQKLEELKVNEQLELGSGRVVSRAVADPYPISPNPSRSGVLGFAIGLVLGLGLAFLLEYMDNSIKTTEDAEKDYGTPVLGYIPAEKIKKGDKRRLSIGLNPSGAAAESYRVLRNNLSFINFKRDIRTLLVTSSAPGEGKSTVAANLATALAHTGVKVVLVNADFRRPVTDEFFDVSNTFGLSDALAGRSNLSDTLQVVEENLSVLNSGPMPPNPADLLGSEKMGEVVKILEALFTWVIIDSPPLLVAADSSALVRWADGVLLVARGGVSTRQAAKEGREMLEKVGARSIGVVLWGVKEGPASAQGAYGAYTAHDPGSGRPGGGK